jgi:MoaA/NifB/PqqE/SkfB family radical SAM enzyme
MEEDRNLQEKERFFTNEADLEARKSRLGLFERDQVQTILQANVKSGKVLFTAGEPTLHPDLPMFVRQAKRLGYKSIGVITNGRRMSYQAYTEALVRSGLNNVVVSIHGHTARLHESLTRTPGSFQQTAGGLKVLTRLRKRYPLSISTSTVVNKRNMEHLSDIIQYLIEGFEPNQIVLNAIQPMGRSDYFFDRLVPKYTEMAEAVTKVLGAENITPALVRLVDVPPCISAKLPKGARGDVEQHQHFERETGLPDGLKTPEGVSLPIRKQDYDVVQRSFGPPCEGCPLQNICDGVWRRYTTTYGWDEFGV